MTRLSVYCILFCNISTNTICQCICCTFGCLWNSPLLTYFNTRNEPCNTNSFARILTIFCVDTNLLNSRNCCSRYA